MLLRFLPGIVELALLIFCLIDCIQTDRLLIRNLRKEAWIFLIIFFPIIGGIAWLVAGRPERAAASSVPWRSTATAGFPEYERPSARTGQIDDQLARNLERVDQEHEEALRRWEQSLREREARLQSEKPDGDDAAPA